MTLIVDSHIEKTNDGDSLKVHYIFLILLTEPQVMKVKYFDIYYVYG